MLIFAMKKNTIIKRVNIAMFNVDLTYLNNDLVTSKH